MVSGWGVDPTIVNNVATSGTGSADVRKIWGALYNPGVISGGLVTRSATNMTYAISAGVAVVRVATGEHIMMPIPATSGLATSNASNRTDIVYAKQNMPAVEGNSNVVVGVSTTVPTNAVVLDRFIISAGQTNTNAAVRTGSVDYSVPYGSTGAVLHFWRDTSNSTITAPVSAGQGTFYLPTDRKLLISVTACVSAIGTAAGFDNAQYTEARYAPYLDGNRVCTWVTPGLTRAWATYQFEEFVNVTAGQHTVYLGYDRHVGPGDPWRHYSGVDKYPGTNFVIRDAGVMD